MRITCVSGRTWNKARQLLLFVHFPIYSWTWTKVRMIHAMHYTYTVQWDFILTFWRIHDAAFRIYLGSSVITTLGTKPNLNTNRSTIVLQFWRCIAWMVSYWVYQRNDKFGMYLLYVVKDIAWIFSTTIVQHAIYPLCTNIVPMFENSKPNFRKYAHKTLWREKSTA